MPELPFPLPPLPTVQQVVFVGIALLTVVGSLAVVLARNLFHSALVDGFASKWDDSYVQDYTLEVTD